VAGKVYLSDAMAERILNRVRGGKPETHTTPVEQLTDRELEVFELIGEGLNTAEIATRLCLSPKTVDAHRQKIKRRLDLQSSGELMRHAVKWNLERSQAVPTHAPLEVASLHEPVQR
jgi:DNA-binding NarL/FixJ family response regulator